LWFSEQPGCAFADYTFGHRKFGGNAQAITKKRWLHHTSLLWDFKPENMALLKHPKRAPEYRAVSSSGLPVHMQVHQDHVKNFY
jgi:hypothetical protein